ncbi:Hypothetical predicted protein [Mytilus galloprovincialis]|uniref:Apple domain-containing protein n=1 Tax=Mytilus galloprovincialis TaxID=29158 RepID=A0A8B6C772_MYTGA|nr:Hypothetical predicted protein [Mytilus galloprovincialis]
MHLHIAEKLHFYELWNYAIKRKIPIRSIITNRVTECKEQCSEIREYGLYCIGFNFDRTLQQCMLLGEPSTEYDTTSEYDITSFRMIEGMTAYCRMDGKVQIGEYKPLYESGASTSDETTTVKDNAKTDRIMNDERGTYILTYQSMQSDSAPLVSNVPFINYHSPIRFNSADSAPLVSNVPFINYHSPIRLSSADLTALQSEQSTVSKNIGQFSGGEQSVAGLSLQITMGFIGIISSAVVLYHAIRMILLVKQMLPNASNEQITQTEVEDHLTDTVTSCITDTDDERIYTIRDIYLNVPPLGHIDVIFK